METANLDGESSLKLRNSFYKLGKSMFEGGDMSLLVFSGMVIKCERPNNRLFQFEGSINLQVCYSHSQKFVQICQHSRWRSQHRVAPNIIVLQPHFCELYTEPSSLATLQFLTFLFFLP